MSGSSAEKEAPPPPVRRLAVTAKGPRPPPALGAAAKANSKAIKVLTAVAAMQPCPSSSQGTDATPPGGQQECDAPGDREPSAAVAEPAAGAGRRALADIVARGSRSARGGPRAGSPVRPRGLSPRAPPLGKGAAPAKGFNYFDQNGCVSDEGLADLDNNGRDTMSHAVFSKTGRHIFVRIAHALRDKDVVEAARIWQGPLTHLCYYQPRDVLVQKHLDAPLTILRRGRDDNGKVVTYGNGGGCGGGSDNDDADGDATAGVSDGDDDDENGPKSAPAGRRERPAAVTTAESKAMRLLLCSRISQARSTLGSGTQVLPADDVAVAKVINPSLPAPPPGEARAPHKGKMSGKTPHLTATHELEEARVALHKCLRAKAMGEGRGAAEGASYRMLYAFFSKVGDPAAPYYASLLYIIEEMRAGLLETPEFAFLRVFRGIVITKPGHSADHFSGRMLGIGSAVLRLAASHDLGAYWRPLGEDARAAIVGPLSFANGSEAGSAGPALLMQALYDGRKPQPDEACGSQQSQASASLSPAAGDAVVMVNLDVAKAFHHLFQPLIVDLVRRKAPKLMWYVRALYSGEGSHIEFRRPDGSTLRRAVQRGVLPGCPLGTFLMSLVLHEHVGSEVATHFADVITALYADDHTAYLKLSRLEAFVTALERLLAGIGCTLQRVKCDVMLVGGTEADAVSLAALAAKIGLTVVDGLVLAGIPVGCDEFRRNWTTNFATKILNEQRALAKLLSEPGFDGLPRKQAWLLGLRYTGPAAFAHATRGLPPSVTQAAAMTLDDGLFDIFLTEMGIRDNWARQTDEQRAFSRLRFGLGMRYGGLGINSCGRAAPAAYLGGVVSTARFLKIMWPLLDAVAFWPEAAAIYEATRAADPAAPIAGFEDLADLVAGRAGKTVQIAVTRLAQIRESTAALLEIEKEDPIRAANLVACKGRASAHLYASPRMLALQLTDDELASDVCRILSLPQTTHGLAADCRLCGARESSATGEHAFLCVHDTSRQLQATDAHAALGAAFQASKSLKLAGAPMRLLVRPYEPTFAEAEQAVGIKLVDPAADSQRRFDVGVTLPAGGRVFIDCMRTATITSDNNHIQKSCRVQGLAAEAGEKVKTYNYQKAISNLADKAHHILFAVIETNGALSTNFNRFVQRLAKLEYPGDPVTDPQGKYDVDGLRSRYTAQLRQRIACGLVRGNHKTYAAWRVACWPPAHAEIA